MNEQELQEFCGNSDTEPSRPYLHSPFSRGDFTYATDGRIMVRIARVASITRDAEQIKTLDKPLEGAENATYHCLPTVDLPQVQKEPCSKCDGRGHEHDCPDCECECVACDGSGHVWERTSVSIGAAPFALRYVNKLQALPEVEVADDNKDGERLLFRFKGGVGSLMPLRRAYDRHLDPWASTKAA